MVEAVDEIEVSPPEWTGPRLASQADLGETRDEPTRASDPASWLCGNTRCLYGRTIRVMSVQFARHLSEGWADITTTRVRVPRGSRKKS